MMERTLVKLLLEQNVNEISWSKMLNLCCINIWSTFVHKKQIFDNFKTSLPDKTENLL